MLNAHPWQEGEEVIVGPMVIRTRAVEHGVPSYAFRIDGPREDLAGDSVLAYSGDTDQCDGVAAVALGADVFLCEASFLESMGEPRGLHLTAKRAGAVAEKGKVGRLVLTHIPPWIDPNTALAEAETTYSGSLEGAYPGLHVLL
jgi:ribonuclease BN (tRNA processing enzyme)